MRYEFIEKGGRAFAKAACCQHALTTAGVRPLEKMRKRDTGATGLATP